MALVEFSQPASRFTGKVGTDSDGQVYYMLAGRGISRRFVLPANPSSSDQQAVRAVRSSLSNQYSSVLTRAEADSWDSFGRNFSRSDRLGRKYQYRGIQAFQAVNAHRVLAGETAVTTPPSFVQVPSPVSVTSVSWDDPLAELNIVLQHAVVTAGIWRLRLTPALSSPVRKAQPAELRFATTAFADSYVTISTSPQTVILQPRFTYAAGQTLGLEITGLSDAYVPGQTLFNRHITIG